MISFGEEKREKYKEGKALSQPYVVFANRHLPLSFLIKVGPVSGVLSFGGFGESYVGPVSGVLSIGGDW
jgi:hypothetical protein